ncbi:hypothetical protein JCM10450v2_007591 [Rhodotorula kratochvilovae]
MPHEVPLYLQVFGDRNEHWLLERYAALFDERANLPAGSHRIELLSSQLGDVLTQLATETTRNATSGTDQELHQMCDTIERSLASPGQVAPDMVEPCKTIHRAIASVLRERGIHRAELHSLGASKRRTGSAGFAAIEGREGSFRRRLIYQRRAY